jgi:hypothetical protein
VAVVSDHIPMLLPDQVIVVVSHRHIDILHTLHIKEHIVLHMMRVIDELQLEKKRGEEKNYM